MFGGLAKTDIRQCVVLVVVSLQLLVTGCATVPQKQAAAPAEQKVQQQAEIKNEPVREPGAVVVRARKYTKFELKKMEAVRRNNGDTVRTFAGASAALAAYIASDSLFSGEAKGKYPVGTLCATAAAAFAGYALSGLIYDMITKR